ncbi:hypothetical protein J6590_026865 [Homalodisca vitripennis]|nr:hypothetical protein J6590_026865 [Homalodisca vitripennis]
MTIGSPTRVERVANACCHAHGYMTVHGITALQGLNGQSPTPLASQLLLGVCTVWQRRSGLVISAGFPQVPSV